MPCTQKGVGEIFISPTLFWLHGTLHLHPSPAVSGKGEVCHAPKERRRDFHLAYALLGAWQTSPSPFTCS